MYLQVSLTHIEEVNQSLSQCHRMGKSSSRGGMCPPCSFSDVKTLGRWWCWWWRWWCSGSKSWGQQMRKYSFLPKTEPALVQSSPRAHTGSLVKTIQKGWLDMVGGWTANVQNIKHCFYYFQSYCNIPSICDGAQVWNGALVCCSCCCFVAVIGVKDVGRYCFLGNPVESLDRHLCQMTKWTARRWRWVCFWQVYCESSR